MLIQAFICLVSAFDLHAQHAPFRQRAAGEYLAELTSKPAKLVSAKAAVTDAHVAELQTQLDARAALCHQGPSSVKLLEVHSDVNTNATHLVVRRNESLLHVRALQFPAAYPGVSLHVAEVDPPLCPDEPEEDAIQVLGKDTTICLETLRWLQGEVTAHRHEACPDGPVAKLSIEHATLKIAAGMIVTFVLRADDGGNGLAEDFPEHLEEKAEERIPKQTSTQPGRYHKVVVSWEYAALRSLQKALRAEQAVTGGEETDFLVPFAELSAPPCDLLSESTFTVGTLPVAGFFQQYGYKGFDKGGEHIDLIPPSVPRALAQKRTKIRRTNMLRAESVVDANCPAVCPDGYSKHFADLFFNKGEPSCYSDCKCSSNANYATVCEMCCKVDKDGSCDAVEAEPKCSDVPPPPEGFDLREERPECFPSTIIEDQGLCGSCFAFASIGSAADRFCLSESSHLIDRKGYRHLFSVQEFLSCNEPEDDPDFPGLISQKWGCGGGYFLAASKYLIRQGAVLQDHYPYTSKCTMEGDGVVNDEEHLESTHIGRHDRTCETMEKWIPRDLLPCACQGHSGKMRVCADSDTTPTKVKSIYRLPNVQDINPHTGTFYKHAETEEMMKIDLMTEGSLYAAFRVYEDFDGYFNQNPGGVYQHRMGQMVGGHAIIIVGWGVKDGIKYWLIRNSWGTNWGDDGHFRIKRGSDECGIEARVWGVSSFDSEEATEPEAVNPWTLYGYHKEMTFKGNTLRQEQPTSLSTLKEKCKFDDDCIGFDSSGVLKRAITEDKDAWVPLKAPIAHGDRVGTTPGGFYTKLTREKVSIQTNTADGRSSGTFGPLEIYLCDEKQECAPFPIEISGVLPGKQTHYKDAWLPARFRLSSVNIHNRNSRDVWVPAGPTIVQLPEVPGSKTVRSKEFNLKGSFAPEAAEWEAAGMHGLLVVLFMLAQ
jgi:cathepsin B